MDLTNLKPLAGPNGEDNTPGLRGYILWAAESWFTTIAKAPKYTGTGTAGASAIIADDHVFKAGFGFLKIYITVDSNQLKADVVGERDGRGLKFSFEGLHPGNKPESLEFLNVVKNVPGIMLVPDADENLIQVGSEGLPVELTPAFDSGKLSSGRRGIMVKGEAYATGIKLYQGDVTMKPAA